MLFINNELLDTKNRSSEYKFSSQVKEYHDAVKKLNEMAGKKKRIVLKSIYPDVYDDKHQLRPRKRQYYPLRAVYAAQDGSGTEEWRWSPNMPTKKNDEYRYSQVADFIVKEWNFSLPRDMEKAFFWIFKSEFVDPGRLCQKEVVKGGVEIEDLEFEAKQEVERKGREASLQYYLYSEESPLSKDEVQMRTIAKAWNIQGVNEMGINQVRLELERKILFNDQHNLDGGVADFLKETDITEITRVKAMIQTGIDEGIVFCNIIKHEWMYRVGEDKTERIFIMSATEMANPEKALLNYLMGSSRRMDIFTAAINGDIDDANKVPSYEELIELATNDWKKYCEICKEKNVRAVGVKKENSAKQLIEEWH